MMYEPEKEHRERVREYNAVGAMVGLMFLALLLIGSALAILLAPAMVATVPPRVQEQPISEE